MRFTRKGYPGEPRRVAPRNDANDGEDEEEIGEQTKEAGGGEEV